MERNVVPFMAPEKRKRKRNEMRYCAATVRIIWVQFSCGSTRLFGNGTAHREVLLRRRRLACNRAELRHDNYKYNHSSNADLRAYGTPILVRKDASHGSNKRAHKRTEPRESERVRGVRILIAVRKVSEDVDD